MYFTLLKCKQFEKLMEQTRKDIAITNKRLHFNQATVAGGNADADAELDE